MECRVKLIINGQERKFEAPLNLYDVLEQTDYVGMLIAVAHNARFIPKAEYKTTHLADGDLIEIVAPMQGG
jgi:sulfur carrier protein